MGDPAIDLRTRFPDPDEILQTIANRVRSQLRTSVPVTVSEDSKDGHTISLQPTTKVTIRLPDGTTKAIALPILPDIPIHHMGGGGVTTTHAHKKGDEGWAMISTVSINSWHQQGGVQAPVNVLTQMLSNALYIPGVRSDPRKLAGVSTGSTQTRTDDKKTVHDVGDKGITSVRGTSVVQVVDALVRLQKDGASQLMDGMSIQKVASKILLNC